MVMSLFAQSCPQPGKASWKLLVYPCRSCLLSVHWWLLSHWFLRNCLAAIQMSTIQCRTPGVSLVSSVIFFSFGPWQCNGVWSAWSRTDWCCVFSEGVQKVCLAIKELYSKIRLPWVGNKVWVTSPAINSSMHNSVQPHAPVMLIPVGPAQYCPSHVQAELLVLPATRQGASIFWLPRLPGSLTPLKLCICSRKPLREQSIQKWKGRDRPEGATKPVLSPQATSHPCSGQAGCCWRVMRHRRQVRQLGISCWESGERIPHLHGPEYCKSFALPLHSHLAYAFSYKSALEDWKM